MKKLLSALLILALALALLSATAFAAGNPELSKYSDAEIKQMYEAFRDEMVARGMPLAAQITLKEGKFIVGEDILPGSYTIKCTETFGDTYGAERIFSREATPSSAPKPSATPTVICTPLSAGCSMTNSAGSWARWAA